MGRLRSAVEQTSTAGDRGGFGAAAGIELGENVGDVNRHRLGADEEQGRYLAIAPARTDMDKHLALARGQLVIGSRGASARLVDLGEERLGTEPGGYLASRCAYGAGLSSWTAGSQDSSQAHGRSRLLEGLADCDEAFDRFTPQLQQIRLRAVRRCP